MHAFPYFRLFLAGCLVAATALIVPVAAADDDEDPAESGPTLFAPGGAPPAGATAPGRVAACRPATPAVGPTPGRSVTVDRGPQECKTVALTFDAGADRGYAELILDILKQNNIPATFGMTGQWTEQNPDLVQRMVADGHQLMNHTWSHRSFTGFSAGRALNTVERRIELERTDELIKGLTGFKIGPYFRPPYGDLNDGVLKDVSDAGYDYTIMWTVDSFGWNNVKAPGIVDRCLSRAGPGVIYLFHVGAQSEDALALGAIINGLRGRGLEFVTIADMLGL
ncbi:MAG: polysaccharide deacetylase family protein [Chloroflexota bacterium]